MKILILGGTRFFGKELAVSCSKKNCAVTVFSRKCPIDGLPPEIKQTRGDRGLKQDLLRMSLGTWDIVVDNICSGADEAEAAVEAFSGRTGLWLFTSSSEIYRVLKGAASPFREIHADTLEEDRAKRASGGCGYAFGKRAAEKIFLSACAEKKFPACILRLPAVIGPDDPTLRAYSYWLRIADGSPLLLPGYASKQRFISSADAVNAVETAAYSKHSKSNVFNFGDSRVLTLSDWVDISAEIMGRKAEKIPVSWDWLEKRNISADFSPYSCVSDQVIDISKAEREFNWTSEPLQSWMKRSIDCFFSQYAGPRPENYSGRKKELEIIAELQREAIYI